MLLIRRIVSARFVVVLQRVSRIFATLFHYFLNSYFSGNGGFGGFQVDKGLHEGRPLDFPFSVESVSDEIHVLFLLKILIYSSVFLLFGVFLSHPRLFFFEFVEIGCVYFVFQLLILNIFPITSGM